jgi:outer membrane protein TolC
MRLFIPLALLTVLSGPLPSAAQEALVTLKDLEQEALRNNPEIQMAVKKAEAAEKRETVASAFPDPMIGYEIQNVGRLSESTVGQEEMSMRGFVMSQEVPFPGKLSTMGQAARKRAEAEQENARETSLKTLSSLRAAYYDYYLAYRSAAILEQTKELMKNFQRIAETRYATGQGLQQDVLRAQLEVSKMLDEIVEQEQKKEAQAAMINGLVGRNPLAPLGRPADRLPTTFDADLDGLAAHAAAHSPVLASRQRMVEMNESELTASKQGYLPDFVLSAGVFDRGSLKDVWTASVMVKVPLWFWNKTAGVNASSAELGSARHEYDATKFMVLSRIRDLYSMAKASEHHIALYEAAIIPQAKMAVQSATANYQVGKIDFLMFLDSQALLLKYQLAYEQELVNLNKSIAQIEEMVGEERK